MRAEFNEAYTHFSSTENFTNTAIMNFINYIESRETAELVCEKDISATTASVLTENTEVYHVIKPHP